MATLLVIGALASAAMQPLLPLAAAAGTPSPAPADFAAIDRYVEAEMRATRLPGLALAIVQGDQIAHLRGFGKADASGRPVTPETPFLIASVTKPLTALAVMQLAEAGRVDLDAPVQRYLPWFRVADPEASAGITVRHLLTHTGGLPTLTGHEEMLLDTALGERALEERVRALRSTRLAAPPGERYQYSNAGYATLALLVQAVSGESYERYLQRHVYAPLDMRRSFVSKEQAREHGLAAGYRYWFGFPLPHDWAYSQAELGAGFTFASAEDLAHYLIAQLDGGRYGDARVLSPEGIAALHRPAVPIPHGGPASAGEHYGMGWFVREAGGLRTVGHAGVAPNYHADLLLVPEGRWGIALLANGENNLRPARIAGIAGGVARQLAGEAVPVPVVRDDAKPALLRVVLLVGALQGLGMVWTVMLLRRWRRQPGRRPRGWLRAGLHVAPPLVLNTLWGLGCLVAVPRLFFWPLSYLRFEVPDLGYALTLSGAVALGWGVLRTALTTWAFLRQGAPLAAAVPAAAERPEGAAMHRGPVAPR